LRKKRDQPSNRFGTQISRGETYTKGGGDLWRDRLKTKKSLSRDYLPNLTSSYMSGGSEGELLLLG